MRLKFTNKEPNLATPHTKEKLAIKSSQFPVFTKA